MRIDSRSDGNPDPRADSHVDPRADGYVNSCTNRYPRANSISIAHSRAADAIKLVASRGECDRFVGMDNGTLVGVTFGPGVHGTDQAFSFAAAADQVDFNTNGGNPGTGAFTFAFAIKTTTATQEQAIWEKRAQRNSDGTSFWGFRMQPSGLVNFEAQNTAGQDYIDLDLTAAVNNGAWHWVAVTRQTTTTSLYVDGQLQSTTTTATTPDISKKTPMRAGTRAVTGSTGPGVREANWTN